MRRAVKEAVGYIRVSTEDQADSGDGLDNQATALRIFAAQMGIKLTWIFDEVASGNDTAPMLERPGLQAAIHASNNGRYPILVANMSRLSRNVARYGEFLQTVKVKVISIAPGETDSAASALKAVQSAEEERRWSAQSTSATLQQMKARGVKLGNVASLPEAWKSSDRVRKFRHHETVMNLRDYFFANPEALPMTLSEKASQLNAAGLRTSRGKPWTKDALKPFLHAVKEKLALLNEPDDVELARAPSTVIAHGFHAESDVSPVGECGQSAHAVREAEVAAGPEVLAVNLDNDLPKSTTKSVPETESQMPTDQTGNARSLAARLLGLLRRLSSRALSLAIRSHRT